MKRILVMLLFGFIRNGYSRAGILKFIGYFHSFGENNFIATPFLGTEPKHISFGSNVWLATRVSLITHDVSVHMIGNREKEYFDSVGFIKIENNVFIGANVVVLPNVRICSNVIIGAGAIVSRSVLESGVYVGSPLRKIASFDDYVSSVKKRSQEFPWFGYLHDRKQNKVILRKKREQYISTKLND